MGDPLLLAARQPVATLTDHGVVAVGQPADEVVQVGGGGGGDQLLVGGVGAGVAQVVGDRGVKQEGVLEGRVASACERARSRQTVAMSTRRLCPAPVARSAVAGFCFPPEVIVLAVR